MTEANAGRVANLLIAAGVAGVGWYIITTPKLRRMAWAVAAGAATGTLPAWLRREVREAWIETGRREI